MTRPTGDCPARKPSVKNARGRTNPRPPKTGQGRPGSVMTGGPTPAVGGPRIHKCHGPGAATTCRPRSTCDLHRPAARLTVDVIGRSASACVPGAAAATSTVRPAARCRRQRHESWNVCHGSWRHPPTAPAGAAPYGPDGLDAHASPPATASACGQRGAHPQLHRNMGTVDQVADRDEPLPVDIELKRRRGDLSARPPGCSRQPLDRHGTAAARRSARSRPRFINVLSHPGPKHRETGVANNSICAGPMT